MDLKKIISRLLHEIADKIDDGSCEMSQQECLDVFNLLAHEALSKEQACKFMNMSRSTFDNYVALGKIPQGRKRVGFKELVWYRDELARSVFRR